VTQNAQASAQPAWLERQSVRRSPSGMSTASIEAPSIRRSRYFAVPSSEISRAAISGRSIRKRSASAARRSFVRSVIAAKSAMPRAWRAS